MGIEANIQQVQTLRLTYLSTLTNPGAISFFMTHVIISTATGFLSIVAELLFLRCAS